MACACLHCFACLRPLRASRAALLLSCARPSCSRARPRPLRRVFALLHNARLVSDRGCSLDLALLPLSVCLCVRFRLVVLGGPGAMCVRVSSSVDVSSGTPGTAPNTTAAGRERFLQVAGLAWCEDGRLHTSQGTQVTLLNFPRRRSKKLRSQNGKNGK